MRSSRPSTSGRQSVYGPSPRAPIDSYDRAVKGRLRTPNVSTRPLEERFPTGPSDPGSIVIFAPSAFES